MRKGKEGYNITFTSFMHKQGHILCTGDVPQNALLFLKVDIDQQGWLFQLIP